MPSVSQGIVLKVGPKPEQELHPGERDVTCGRGHTHHGEFGAAGLLIRHKGDDGKWRYLLQKRSPDEDDPGTWSLPGGALLQGEGAEQGAFREAQEEMGPLPPMVSVHHHVTDDHDGWAWTTVVCDTPETFAPELNGAETAFETDGFGWFTKDEIGQLPLHPGFKDSWEAVLGARVNSTVKCAIRRVGLNGQQFWEHPDPCPCKNPMGGDHAAGGGGPQFMPHDAEGIQQGRAEGSRAGGTAGHYDDAGVVTIGRPSPEWEDDSEYPQRRALVPDQRYSGDLRSYAGGAWPQGGPGTGQPGGMQPVASAPRGVGKGGPAVPDIADAARVSGPAGEEVYRQMLENFPSSVLGWMTRSAWTGPGDIPLNQIDYSDKKRWSAWKEQDRVRHFEKLIGDGEKFNPVVTVRVPGRKRLRVVDGHHRALAYLNLGKPVRGYTGDIPAELAEQAEETHSSQLHQGDSKENE